MQSRRLDAARRLSVIATAAVTLSLFGIPLLAQPAQSVRELVPSAAPIGARVMVTGRGLADPNIAVALGSLSATVVQRDDRFIEVVVPSSATSGNVRITRGATFIRELPFIVSADPKYIVSTLAGGKEDPASAPSSLRAGGGDPPRVEADARAMSALSSSGMKGLTFERTKDGRVLTCGLAEVGLHELSTRDPGEERRDAACDLLRRLAAYQMSEDDPFEAGQEIVDGSDRLRTRRAIDGTLEVVFATSH